MKLIFYWEINPNLIGILVCQIVASERKIKNCSVVIDQTNGILIG